MRNFAALLLVVSLGAARADEGMWMPEQLPALAGPLRARGFRGDVRALANRDAAPLGAVVWLGGCTGSFVSPDGLIATNHHCVLGALQYRSTAARDLLRGGFVARTRAEEEWSGPGARVYVTRRVSDVTEAMLGAIPAGLDDRARGALLERRVKERLAACEQDGLRCTVAPAYDGLRWLETTQLEISDVRLVYAPPDQVGAFGGNADNWRWPRHAGDFALLRAYVGADGKGAAHAPGNVPYRPRHWLQVSSSGVAVGQLVLVAGHPWRTARHATLGEQQELLEWGYPLQVRRAAEQIALLEAIARTGRERALRVEGKLRGLSNAQKKRLGVLEAARAEALLDRKHQEEARLRAFIDARPAHRAHYRGALEKLEALRLGRARHRERDAVLELLLPGPHSHQGGLLAAARTLWRLAEERTRPDLERAPDYQARNGRRLREVQLRLDRTLDLAADRALLRYALLEAAALPQEQRLEPVDRLLCLVPGQPAAESARAADALLDRVYAGTRLADLELRLRLLEATPEALRAAADPMLELGAALLPAEREAEERAREQAGGLSRVRPAYLQALREVAGGELAPDADGTLRVSFGLVQGVAPRDGLAYQAQTTLLGILEKHRAGDPEFEAPAGLLEAIRAERRRPAGRYRDARLGDVPVAFLSTADTTGGNSGSPVLDARGRMVGLLFDGIWESVASDLIHDPARTRSIQVDVRYLLWTLESVARADHLLAELQVQ